MASSFETSGVYGGDSGTNTASPGGYRVVQTMNLSTRTFIGFRLSTNEMQPANLQSFANGGIRIVFQDGGGNWAAYTIHGGNVRSYMVSLQGAFDRYTGLLGNEGNSIINWWFDRNTPPTFSSGTLDWSNITAHELHLRPNESMRLQLACGVFSTADLPLHTGTQGSQGVPFDINAAYAANSGGNWASTWIFRNAPNYYFATGQVPASVSLGFQLGNGSTTTSCNLTGRSIMFPPLWADNVTGVADVPNTATLLSSPRLVDIFQAAADNVTIADCLLSAGRLWGLRVRGNTAGIAALNRNTYVRYAQMELGHSTSTDCIWDGGTVPIQATANTTITRGTIRNATTGGLTITGAAGDYSAKVDATFASNTTFDVAMGSGGAGPSSNVVVTSTTGLTNTQLRASPIETTSGQFKQLLEEVGSITYIGKAAAGTAGGAASWSIKRITFGTGTINTEWAGGTTAFNQVWNNRASLSYS
jgi:hypothetical protein